MANPNDPQLMEQKRTLGDQIDAVKAQLAADPDNEALKANLADLETQEKALNDQLKASRQANKPDRGRGRATAPGQQKKQP